MSQSTFIGLIYNAALLLALGIIFDSITLRSYRNTIWAKILTGISLGSVVLAIMINPWVLKPGIVFDTRSILLSMTAMFFGIIPTSIATIIALIYRIWQGGAGIYMGCSVILASVLWGYVWKRLHYRWKKPYGFVEFYLLGIITHITMLGLTVLLPESIRSNVFNNIAMPVIVIYPVVTVLLGQILARRIQRLQDKYELEESEKQFRSLYDNAPMAYQSLDEYGNFLTVNKAWLQVLGFTEEEILGRNFAEILHPDYRDHFAQNFPNFKSAGHIEGVEFVFLKKDGTPILVSFNGKIVNHQDGSFKQTQCVFTDITERRKQEAALRSIEWMLTKQHVETDTMASYGDLTEHNTSRLILDSVGKDVLKELVSDYLSLLDTSSAVYEKNGDYAVGIFTSSWCQYLDFASRQLCETESNTEALICGKWLCHESCWNDVSLKAIETGEVVDLECNGGLNLYAVPIKTSAGIIGAINLGYGQPPADIVKLQEISDKYKVNLEELRLKAEQYQIRPAFIIAQAKRKLHTAARVIGEIVERKQAELELERLSVRQQAILSSVPDIIMQVDVNKVYTWANQAGYDFFGEDVIGREASEYFVRDQVTYDTVQPLFDGDDKVIYVESWQRRKDGSERLLAWWCKVLRDEQGVVSGALSSAWDVTDQRLLEEELNNYFTKALDLFAIADTDGYFRRLNKSWEQTLGYKMEDLENARFLDFVHPDDMEATLEAISELSNQVEILSFVNRYRHKDGTYRWIEWRSYPAGKRIYSAARDITEIKNANDELLRIKQDWEIIFQSIPHATYILDKDQNILAANRYIEKALGMTAEQMQGKKCWELMHGEGIHEPPPGCPFAQDFNAETANVSEVEVQTLGGYYMVSCNPIYDHNGDIDKVIHIAMDITDRKNAELILAESEEKYRVLTETAQDIILVHALDGSLSYANKVALEFLGITPDSLPEFNIWSVILPEYQDMMYQHVLERGAGFTGSRLYQLELLNHAKQRRMLEVSSTPIISNGHVTGFLALMRDITQRLQDHIAIIESEEKYRSLVESSDSVIAMFDSKAIIHFANHKAAQSFGLIEEDLVGKSMFEIFPQEIADYQFSLVNEVIQTGVSKVVESCSVIAGRDVWFHTSICPVMSADGIPKLAVVNATDITHIKQADIALKESEKKYRNLIETANEGIYIMDANLVTTFVNKRLCQMVGYSEEEMIGIHIDDFIPTDELPDHHNKMGERQNGFDDHYERRIVTRDGSDLWILVSAKSMKNEAGEFTGAFVMITDITKLKQSELALLESQARFELFMEYFPGGAFISDKESKALFVNKYLLDAFGEKGGVGSTPLDSFPEDLGAAVMADDQLALKQGYRHVEQSVPHADGKTHIYDSIKFAIKRQNAEDLLGGIILDITDKKKAELALIESQSNFEQFMNQIPGNVFIKDSDSRFLYVNNHMEKVYGAGSWIGKTPDEVLSLEEARNVLDNDKEVKEAGIIQMVDAKADANGQIHYYETTKFTIDRPNGEPLIGGLSLDVTAKVLAEEERNHYSQRLEILHQIDTGILESSSLEQILEISLKQLNKLIPCKTCSISALDSSRNDWYSIYLEEGLPFEMKREKTPQIPVDFEAELYAGKTVYLPDVQTTKPEISEYRKQLVQNGLICFLHIPLVMQGHYFGSINFADDRAYYFSEEQIVVVSEIAVQITVAIQQMHLTQSIIQHADELEIKVEERTNELRIANKELEAFSYTVAHDLRSPLRSIDGYSTMLLEDYSQSLDLEAISLLNVIKSSTLKMDTLIKSMLELAKLSRDSMKIKRVDMHKLAESVFQEITDAETRAQFILQISEIPEIYADQTLISQVWQNLLLNSIKFSQPCDEKSIQIGHYLRENEVVYFVKDCGVGFDMKYVDKIFGPFQRLHRATDFEGTGIGLTIVKKIIERHNGEIWAESEVGKGATIYFSLPVISQ